MSPCQHQSPTASRRPRGDPSSSHELTCHCDPGPGTNTCPRNTLSFCVHPPHRGCAHRPKCGPHPAINAPGRASQTRSNLPERTCLGAPPMGLSGSGDGQQFEAAGGRCSGAPRSHCPSPGQRDPLRAPPGPTSLGDSVSDKRRKPPQVQATDSGASTCQGPRWPGAGLVGNALICPESQIKVPVSALPGSRSPCPPSHNQSPQVHPSPVKIPTHKPPSRNKMEQSPSNPGTVPGSDPAHGRFRHLPPKSGEAPRLGRPRGPDGHTCTARCPLQPRRRHRATLAHQDPRARV